MPDITSQEIQALQQQFEVLIGLRVDWLSLPQQALPGFEPSQIAVIVNTLLDAALPQIELLATNPENRKKLEHLGLSKAPGEIGDRESYPDYIHASGYRVELKGLFVDNPSLDLKRPSTRREPSARLKENITMENVDPAKDVLMLAAVQLREFDGLCYPVIVDVGIFSMVECIHARDDRLISLGGRWHNGVPQVIQRASSAKYRDGLPLTDSDYQKDTNFGKLKRIPYPPLQEFMYKLGAI
jgi:hypothetical protein